MQPTRLTTTVYPIDEKKPVLARRAPTPGLWEQSRLDANSSPTCRRSVFPSDPGLKLSEWNECCMDSTASDDHFIGVRE